MPAAFNPRSQPSSRPRGEVDRLRGVPGGYDIDRLPISVPRRDGELLESWLHRTAYRYGLHPRAMLTELGVTVGPQRLLRLQEVLTDAIAARVAGRMVLVPESLVARSALSRALSTARIRWRTEFRGMKPRSPMRGTRWCPHCLTESDCWREIWSDPLYVYCEVHFVELLTGCPTCRTVPYSTTAWITSLEDHLRCPTFVDEASSTSSRYRRRCGTRLDQARAPHARDLAVDDQQYLLTLALRGANEPDALVEVCGIEARAQVAFEAVLEMIEEATGAPTLPIPTESTDHLKDAIRGSAEVLRQPSLRMAYDTARGWNLVWRTSALEVLEPKSIVRTYARNPLITAMWLDELRGSFSPAHELRFRMGSPRPRYPDGWQDHDRYLQTKDSRPGLPIAWIPQVAWPGSLDLPDAAALGLDTAHGRAFISMCLARYGTTREWREIATCLGLPAHSARRLQRTWGTITAAGRVPDFLSAIDALFHRVHDSPPPIDYEARRASLWRSDFPPELSFLGKIRNAQPAKLPFAETRRQFWALYTGGATRFAPPAYLAPVRPHATRDPDADNVSLISVEEHLPSTFRDGPLSWTPP